MEIVNSIIYKVLKINKNLKKWVREVLLKGLSHKRTRQYVSRSVSEQRLHKNLERS